MTISVKSAMIFSLMASIDGVLSLEENELLDQLCDSEEAASGYLEITKLLSQGISEEDFNKTCQDINVTYSNLSKEIDVLKEVFKGAIKGEEVDSIS